VNASTDDLERDRADSVTADARVLVEQIGYVHNQGVAGASAMLAIAVLYVGVLWSVTDHRHLLLWLTAMALICAARFAFALHWRRSASTHATVFWSRAALIINALAGAAWGYAAVALFPLGHPDKYIVSAFVLVGMPAAALTSLGAWAPAFAAYALMAIVPFVLWMFSLAQSQFMIVGIAGSIFCAYLLRQAQQTSATIRRNIAQRIELEQMSRSLSQARDAAESASRAKSNFLTNMSHELRTPLNAVVGLSDLLVEQPDGRRGRDLALTMRQSALSLLGVIDHVLDMSRIEAGKIELRPRNFDVRALMREVHAMFNPEAQRRGIAFSVDVDGGVPPQVTGDPDRIRQVLVNLIDNGLKFTVAGSVAVAVTAGTRGDGRYLLRFDVADTGSGIDESVRPRLFAALAHNDDSFTRSPGGIGLGLSISAALVKLMGGEIDHRSESGRGAVFWFTSAVGLAPPTITKEIAANSPLTAPRSVSPRILIIDDNTVNLLLTKEMLQAFGCNVYSASDGSDGLNRMKSEAFDLVFMDISMPGMDGIEATRAWRAHEQSSESRLPIVALTANAMVGDRQTCIAAGMDDYIAKPVTLDALRRMVARHVPGVVN
jgi:signal transduction histidine kinase/ActR/RegA family two-component response regulator